MMEATTYYLTEKRHNGRMLCASTQFLAVMDKAPIDRQGSIDANVQLTVGHLVSIASTAGNVDQY